MNRTTITTTTRDLMINYIIDNMWDIMHDDNIRTPEGIYEALSLCHNEALLADVPNSVITTFTYAVLNLYTVRTGGNMHFTELPKGGNKVMFKELLRAYTLLDYKNNVATPTPYRSDNKVFIISEPELAPTLIDKFPLTGWDNAFEFAMLVEAMLYSEGMLDLFVITPDEGFYVPIYDYVMGWYVNNEYIIYDGKGGCIVNKFR